MKCVPEFALPFETAHTLNYTRANYFFALNDEEAATF